MKKTFISLAVLAAVLSGSPAFATENAATPTTTGGNTLTRPQINAVENIAQTGNEAMQDVQLARVMLFNGNTSEARKLLQDADKKINDDKTDWQKFIKQNKKPPVDGDGYVIINATMSVSEDFQPSEAKTRAINDANKKLSQGDKKGAIETLRLAGITMTENQLLMPLQQTRTDIKKAINLFDKGKYYQSNLVLLSAEQGLVVDSEVVQE